MWHHDRLASCRSPRRAAIARGPSQLCPRAGADTRARHRRDHDDLQLRVRAASQAVSVSRARSPRPRADGRHRGGGGAAWLLAPGHRGLPAAEHAAGRHRRLHGLRHPAPDRRSARDRQHVADQRADAGHARRRTPRGPAAPARGGRAGRRRPPSGYLAQPLAGALRRGSVHRRQAAAHRPSDLYHRGCDAAGVPLSGSCGRLDPDGVVVRGPAARGRSQVEAAHVTHLRHDCAPEARCGRGRSRGGHEPRGRCAGARVPQRQRRRARRADAATRV